ncbi:MAG: coenzyme F420-0:L-glutamate ligase [Candidatus Bathyarchaeota archaeon]|nr:MAG: coenzyme F420-0:L-glutamate ligase [Candidatus Bathyarchaeota archaeon]
MRRVYRTITPYTGYWRPGEDYLYQIIEAIRGKVEDYDTVAVSEKAVSTALGNIVDESVIEPSLTARLLARYWMRYAWGYIFGPLCRLRTTTIQHLRDYPLEEGSAHKQVALEQAGFLQALLFGSEGGIDGSNLPYSYVSLPLVNASQTAQQIRRRIESTLGKDVAVIMVDTDSTYSIGSFHFTPRPNPIKGIHSTGGFLAYLAGRLLHTKRRATPVAHVGSRMNTEDALELAKIANKARGFGAGKTVWDMAEAFRVPITDVTWEMLTTNAHRPIVIVKTSYNRKR